MESTNNTALSLATQLNNAKLALNNAKLASEKLASSKLISQLNKAIADAAKVTTISSDASESTTKGEKFDYLRFSDYSRESITTASSDAIFDTKVVAIIGADAQNCLIGVPTLTKHGGLNTASMGCKYSYFNLLENRMQSFNRTLSDKVDGKSVTKLEPNNNVLAIELNGIIYTNPSQIFALLKYVELTTSFNKLLASEKYEDANIIGEKLDALLVEFPIFATATDLDAVSLTGTKVLASTTMEQYQTLVSLEANVLNEDGTINEVSTNEAKELATKKLVKLRNKVVPIFEREIPKVEPTK